MELRYGFVIIIGIVVVFALSLLKFKKNNQYKGGKKVAAAAIYKESKYFKRRIISYKILTVILYISCIAAILVSSFILARPYKTEIVNKEQYSRDILMCIDISYSVDELNMNLIDEMKETVKKLNGERIGIVIFNTSPVLLVPLTDDYEYVINTLDTVKTAIKDRSMTFGYSDDWMYLNEYITGGTLIGNEQRGSSLIGDGLAATVKDFSDLEEDRTRVVIFSTDNDLQGTPIFTLDEAGTLCKENNVIVYGIGTEVMLSQDMSSMKNAVEKTGGSFYLEEESGSMAQIIDNINGLSKSLVKVDREVRVVDFVDIPFYFLLCSLGLMIVLAKFTKR